MLGSHVSKYSSTTEHNHGFFGGLGDKPTRPTSQLAVCFGTHGSAPGLSQNAVYPLKLPFNRGK